jgi:PAS domain S-box-containing protein
MDHNYSAVPADLTDTNHKSIFNSVLIELKRLDETNLNLLLKKVLEIISNTFKIERVSIWFYDEGKQTISCYYLYARSKNDFVNESPIIVKEYPAYFKAIESGSAVMADDALNHPVTKELAQKYLVPRNILSMMDIPICYLDNTIGILCHEVTGEKRNWLEEEKEFAAAISSIITNAIQIDIRQQFNKGLRESQRFLTTLISNLPGYVYRVRKEKDDWTIQYLSEGIFDLTGYRPSELIESDSLYYGLMVDENDKKLAKISVNEALNSKKPYQITYKIKTTSGDLKWVWERGRGVYNDKGDLVATEGFITDITEQKLAEEELIEKNRELSMINLISQSLSRLTERDRLISDICVMLGKLFNIENLYIALYDSDKNMISFPFYSIEGKKIQTSSRVFGNGLTEFVIKTKKSLMINSAKHEIIDSLGITPHGKEALSVISTPMIAGEKVIGVITLQDYKRENVFSQSQLDTLSTISSQAAIAIENAELYSSLKRSLLEKEILLKEVHHRVKNNLQIMSSLIKLQSHYVSDKQMLQILNETESRIQSMAIVHSKLYSTQEYEKVNFGEYVKNLTDNFWNTYGIKLKNLNFDIQVENISINIDTAIPCGLIINELVSNSIKYAFPDNRKGTITIILMKESSSRFYKLIVKDDGIGMKKAVKIEKADTLGIQLVNLLTKQMNGTFEIKSEKNKGCQIIITLEESIYRARN